MSRIQPSALTPATASRRRRVENGLGALWLVLGLGVVLFGLWWFYGDYIELKSFWLMLLSGTVLLALSAFMLVPLPGRRWVAIVVAVLTGFREYMLWAHGMPESIDLAVIRSVLVLVLAVVTIAFYAVPDPRVRPE